MFVSGRRIGSFVVGVEFVFVYFGVFIRVGRWFGHMRRLIGFGRVLGRWCVRICRCLIRLHLLQLFVIVVSEHRVTAVRRWRHYGTLSRINKRIVRFVSQQCDLIGQIRARCRIAHCIRVAIRHIKHCRRGFIAFDGLQFQLENRLWQIVLQFGSFHVFRVELRTLYENFDRLLVN